MKLHRIRRHWSLIWLLVGFGTTQTWAAPIDEFRISVLEQQLRDLQNAVREQSRVIAEWQRSNPQLNKSVAPAVQNRTVTSEQRWLSVKNWQKLQPGMSELAVIDLLGPPTQFRAEDVHGRQLFYALEIGGSGFLSGKVTMHDGKVVQIDIPSLR